MDVKQLRYFLAIHEYGSIAKAANQIFISQQGLSMALLRLESELGCRLMERTPEGMRLTSNGEALLPKAQRIVEEFDEIDGLFFSERKEKQPITIGCCLGAIPEYLAPIIFEFRRQYPDYEINIVETNDIDTISNVEQKKVDLGFSVAPIDGAIFKKFPIFTSPICLLVNNSSPLAELKRGTASDILRDNPVMIMNKKSNTYRIVSDYCRSNGFELKVQYYASEVISIHRMVASNLGMGVSVHSVANDIPKPQITVVPFREPQLIWELDIFRRKDTPLSPAAKLFEQYVFNYRDRLKNKGVNKPLSSL